MGQLRTANKRRRRALVLAAQREKATGPVVRTSVAEPARTVR